MRDWTVFGRQPVMALAQIIFKTIIQLAKIFWPAILYILLRADGKNNEGDDFIFIIFPVIALIKSFFDFIFFKFRVTEEDIQVKSGILSRKQITLPLYKIQTVHINQTWIQKIFNISELAFDSPGTEKAEITIQLRQLEAEELMGIVLKKNKSAAAVENHEEQISQLSLIDLLKLGLTSNHFETLLIIIGLFLSFLNNIKDIVDDYNDNLLEDSTNIILGSSILLILTGVFALFLLSILASLIRTILSYINFRITKSTSGFVVNKGLINKSQKLVPFKKVQYISWKTNWIRKKISMYIFEFHTIGKKELKNNLKIKVPVISIPVLTELAKSYSTDISEHFPSGLKVHPTFLYRNTFFWGILPVLLIFFPIFLYNKSFSIALLLIPLYVFLHYYLYTKKFLFSWSDNLIEVQKGVFGKQIVILKWENIQSIKISQSLYQGQKSLANLIIYTAGGTITAPYIPIEAAQELQNFGLFKVENSVNHWQ